MKRGMLILAGFLIFSITACVKKGKPVISTVMLESSPPAEEKSQDQNRLLPLPLFVADIPNPNDFSLFATGGFDGNWYVGYDTTWVFKLPKIPRGKYSRAFIGARLGRAKGEPVPGRPTWEKRAIPGEIRIAMSSEPLWPESRRYSLVLTKDIPMEGDPTDAIEMVGESRWFWVEIPLSFVNLRGDNYIVLYCPSEALKDARTSPILGAGWGTKEKNTWLNRESVGSPPSSKEQALKTNVSFFKPALALKLIPSIKETPRVKVIDFLEGKVSSEKMTVSVTGSGQNIERVWLEVSGDKGKSWKRVGRYLYGAPYIFTIRAEELPPGRIFMRAGASNVWENTGYSKIFKVAVSTRKNN